MAKSDQDRLFELMNERAYREGDFTLASGARSSFYFDSKPVLLDGEGARVVARLILADIARLRLAPVAVGGMELGAVPIACAVSALSPEPPLRVFIVRKQPKAHGTGQALEGRLEPGDRVVVVEDVVTTGESTWKALQAVEAAGGQVVGVFALLDREAGHLPAFDRYADRFHPLMTLSEFRRRRAASRG
ncbi:MAG TPA: orotate phosphoribosyltransferase [Polyangia bacterium]|nr:orotate phosphoribosyltransferase [Polyangia bacterium]